jgi:integrase
VRKKTKLYDEHTRRFLAALPYELRVMCCTGLFCTLRVSEMLGLQEKHLDFEGDVIQVRQRFYREDLRSTKSSNSDRDIPMGYLAPELKSLCLGDPERFVFSNRYAPAMGRKASICRDDRDLNQHFLRPIAKRLGMYFEGFGFHSLRREAVTSIAKLASINQAMNASGHSTTDMSLLYTLQDLSEQDKAIRTHQERILGLTPTDSKVLN